MKKDGDKLFADFKKIYETHVSLLVNFACRFVPSEAAKDIVQDVFLAVWEQNMEYKEETIRHYLLIAVKNRCLNFIRQQQLKTDLINQYNYLLELQYYDSAEKLIVAEEDLAYIHEQINLLPPKSQLIFRMAYLEEKKSAAIAQELNLSQRTVEHHIYLAISKLRSIILGKEKK